jgi:DNA-nicking Smr family endonuclease
MAFFKKGAPDGVEVVTGKGRQKKGPGHFILKPRVGIRRGFC